jgi:hypothetical protein
MQDFDCGANQFESNRQQASLLWNAVMNKEIRGQQRKRLQVAMRLRFEKP